jgi:hypothetical protein
VAAIAAVLAVALEAPIVRAVPGLGGVYAAMGLAPAPGHHAGRRP